MTKSELRTLYRKKRKQFSQKEIDQFTSGILENLKTLPIWENEVFHIYVPIRAKNEINTWLIINYLHDLGKTIVVPKIEGDQLLSCKIDAETEWEIQSFGVPEPKNPELFDSSQIEVVFVPMLICDYTGHRIGYGGGFYDRFLGSLSPNVLKVGLNLFAPIDKIEEVESTDIPLDYCVTSSEIVSFTS